LINLKVLYKKSQSTGAQVIKVLNRAIQLRYASEIRTSGQALEESLFGGLNVAVAARLEDSGAFRQIHHLRGIRQWGLSHSVPSMAKNRGPRSASGASSFDFLSTRFPIEDNSPRAPVLWRPWCAR
jgi:hypothetical protein